MILFLIFSLLAPCPSGDQARVRHDFLQGFQKGYRAQSDTTRAPRARLEAAFFLPEPRQRRISGLEAFPTGRRRPEIGSAKGSRWVNGPDDRVHPHGGFWRALWASDRPKTRRYVPGQSGMRLVGSGSFEDHPSTGAGRCIGGQPHGLTSRDGVDAA